MTPESSRTREESDQNRSNRVGPATPEPPDATEPEKPATVFGSLREAYRRARDGRQVGQARRPTRTAKTVDRSKGLLVLAAAVIVMFFVFLGLYSSPGGVRNGAGRRTEPSLGRPALPATHGSERTGSVAPLLSAATSEDANGDQVSPDDVKATGRLRMRTPPKPGSTLASIPPMDTALDAYRRAKLGPDAPAPPPVAANGPAPGPAPAPPHNEADALKKSSLVFVRNNNSAASANAIRPAALSAAPAILEQRTSPPLPNGSRLVARLQSTVSTAVKAPVVAAIEYSYERDGENIIPAGTKALGDLQQANKNGEVAIHFHTLELPDGTAHKIDAVSMSLNYGPLKGSVSGGNRMKRILVRSMTGVGTMAAYLVGGPGGFGGISGQLDNSVLLRERIASNAGLAGEQEMESLAFNQNIVVSVPGNTRFFIVLVEGAGQRLPARTIPAAGGGATQFAAAGAAPLPSAQELRELIELKAELNRMYRDVTATQAAAPATTPEHP